MSEGEPLPLDLMVGNPLVPAGEAGEGGVPFDLREAEFLGYLVVEVSAGRMFVIREVESPFQMVAMRVVDGVDAVGLMDHIGVLFSRAGKGVPCDLPDPLGKFASGSVDFSEAENADAPPEFFEGRVDVFRIDEDFSRLPFCEALARLIDP